MNILETNIFGKAFKKLHRNQIDKLKKVIEEIKKNPEIGEMKKGDLAGVRVYKFHFHHQLVLLAYTYESDKEGSKITLLDISSHENFYTNLKKQV
jgi:mRNA-degrading endonuclease RelE of RelBE toxin-antitoxin system